MSTPLFSEPQLRILEPLNLQRYLCYTELFLKLKQNSLKYYPGNGECNPPICRRRGSTSRGSRGKYAPRTPSLGSSTPELIFHNSFKQTTEWHLLQSKSHIGGTFSVLDRAILMLSDWAIVGARHRHRIVTRREISLEQYRM